MFPGREKLVKILLYTYLRNFKILSFLGSYGSLREKCPNAEYLSVFSPNVENTDQKKLRIWTLFTQWLSEDFS